MLQSTAENSSDVLPAERDKGARIQRFLFAVLGLLLLVTAWLKIQGPADGALGQNTILFSPRLRFLVIEAEALLGLLLLSGWARRAAWFFAAAFFLMVAGVSLYLGLMGQSSCGCFGRIQVSPWSAFTLDVACLAALGLCRPSFSRVGSEDPTTSRRMREALTILGGAGVIVAVCLGGVLLAGGNRPGDFLARVRGDRITVEPAVTDMGSGVSGVKRQLTVRLHNHTERPITIIGGTASCSCMVIDDLPVTIPPNGSALVTVRATFKGTPGLFQQEFLLYYADGDEQARVMARFAGRVVEEATKDRDKTP